MTNPEVLNALAERLEHESRTMFPMRMRDGFSYHNTASLLDKAAVAIRAYAKQTR